MREAFLEILNNYLDAKQQDFANNPLADFIRHQAPDSIVSSGELPLDYITDGSPGKGRWADIPWICIFDKAITTTAQTGYYIVYLFDANMEGIYLSLAIGWTQFENKYGIKNGRAQIAKVSEYSRGLIDYSLKAFPEYDINLHSQKPLGLGYEAGQICAKYYPKDSLPRDEELVSDLHNLIEIYKVLKNRLEGRQILNISENIDNIMEDEEEKDDSRYQKEVQKVKPKRVAYDVKNGPESYIQNRVKKWKTNPAIGKQALEDASYLCEIDRNHKTFISRATGKNYVEAHHLIPMRVQGNFKSDPLDVNGNIVALCPNCHRKLHHGKKEEIESMLDLLFKKHKEELYKYNLNISVGDLYSYYQ